MKVLVAVQDRAQTRMDGPVGCIEGELVWMVDRCPSSLRDPDGPCPCGRTFRGKFTDGLTAVAMVREIEGMTRADDVSAMTMCHESREECTCGTDPTRVVDELIKLVRGIPVGTVFARRVGLVEMEHL